MECVFDTFFVELYILSCLSNSRSQWRPMFSAVRFHFDTVKRCFNTKLYVILRSCCLLSLVMLYTGFPCRKVTMAWRTRMWFFVVQPMTSPVSWRSTSAAWLGPLVGGEVDEAVVAVGLLPPCRSKDLHRSMMW